MKKGSIVLIPFPFTDLSGNKTRPALILVVDKSDVTVAFITSKAVNADTKDVTLKSTNANGLKVDSIIKLNKLATIETTLILGELGSLSVSELSEVNEKLKFVFDLI